jgi:hypothetical protein
MRLSGGVVWGMLVLGMLATAASASTSRVVLIEDFDATW